MARTRRSASALTSYMSPTTPGRLGCHLALGWPLPSRVLDLHAEFRCLTSGLAILKGRDLAGALAHYRVEGGDVADLLAAMLPDIDLPRALLRGRYAVAVARMEALGVPLDMEMLVRLRNGWERLQGVLIEQVDSQYGVFRSGEVCPRLWNAWVNRHRIPWPRLSPGRLDLNLDTFSDMAATYPEVLPMKELRATLAQMRPTNLAVGRDGRNRCSLRPFAAKTGRNAPSTSKFIFGPAVWLRGLIRPQPGMALAYVDYEQQEFGIAAALSKDEAMMAAYRTEDPYLAFAKQARPCRGTQRRSRTQTSGSSLLSTVPSAFSTGCGSGAWPAGSTSRWRMPACCCGCTATPTPPTGDGQRRWAAWPAAMADSSQRSAGRSTLSRGLIRGACGTS